MYERGKSHGMSVCRSPSHIVTRTNPAATPPPYFTPKLHDARPRCLKHLLTNHKSQHRRPARRYPGSLPELGTRLRDSFEISRVLFPSAPTPTKHQSEDQEDCPLIRVADADPSSNARPPRPTPRLPVQQATCSPPNNNGPRGLRRRGYATTRRSLLGWHVVHNGFGQKYTGLDSTGRGYGN